MTISYKIKQDNNYTTNCWTWQTTRKGYCTSSCPPWKV